MADFVVDGLSEIILATGALGIAASGIVEGLKVWSVDGIGLGLSGFGKLKSTLGVLWKTLPVAYGDGYLDMLRALYRGDRNEMERALRQGIRIGLTPKNAAEMATILGTIAPADLVAVATHVEKGETPPDHLRNVLGRFELAADARVDAAITLAEAQYAGALKMAALIVAVVVALVVGFLTDTTWLPALLIGLAAVPLAPIAHDVASAVNAAAQALRKKT